jgi:hypothetical protein
MGAASTLDDALLRADYDLLESATCFCIAATSMGEAVCAACFRALAPDDHAKLETLSPGEASVACRARPGNMDSYGVVESTLSAAAELAASETPPQRLTSNGLIESAPASPFAQSLQTVRQDASDKVLAFYVECGLPQNFFIRLDPMINCRKNGLLIRSRRPA